MPILLNENQPSTTSSRFIIVAKTGRRMQRLARLTPACVPTISRGVLAFIDRLLGTGVGDALDRLRFLHAHLRALVKFCLPCHDDGFARLYAGENFLLAV